MKFKKDFNYKYAFLEDWEFLIFSIKDYYFLDVNSLNKIERITGMIIVQIKSCDGIAELWFGRRMEAAQKNKNLKNRIT